MKAKTFAIVLSSLCVLGLALGLLAIPRAAVRQAPGQAINATPLRPQVAATLKAQGKPSPELRFANLKNHGRPFNPSDAYPFPGGIDPAGLTLKALVILVEFSDTAHTYERSTFDDLVFGTTYDPAGNSVTLEDGTVVHGPTDRTLPNFFDEISYGGVGITGSVTQWVKVGRPYSYYSSATPPYQNGFGPYPNNVQGLVEDAVLAADAQVDFSQFDTLDPYDQDGDANILEPDGVVDNLIIVHTGSGAEWTAQPDTIWSHQSSLGPDGYGNEMDSVIVDEVQVLPYCMLPEYGGWPMDAKGVVADPYPPTVGVYAHEFSHILGIPDEYDYGYESHGTGAWSLMAAGSWNTYPAYERFAGNSPAHPSAWAQIGIIHPIVVTPGQLVEAVLPPIENEPVVYRIDVPYSGGVESFLLENRQQIGFDQGLESFSPDAHGLLVYHIDDTVIYRNYWLPNEAQNWKENRWLPWKAAWTGERHYGVSIIQADDLWSLEKGLSAIDYGGHPYPGTKGKTSLTDSTFPNTTSYYFWKGSSPPFGHTYISITNITETDGVIRATLWVPEE